MGNIREDYKVKPNKNENKNENEYNNKSNKKKHHDPYAFPFGTDEALFMQELEELDRDER